MNKIVLLSIGYLLYTIRCKGYCGDIKVIINTVAIDKDGKHKVVEFNKDTYVDDKEVANEICDAYVEDIGKYKIDNDSIIEVCVDIYTGDKNKRLSYVKLIP